MLHNSIFHFSLSSTSLTHSFSVISENSTINHTLLKSTLGYNFTNSMGLTSTTDVIGPQRCRIWCNKLQKITAIKRFKVTNFGTNGKPIFCDFLCVNIGNLLLVLHRFTDIEFLRTPLCIPKCVQHAITASSLRSWK